MLFIIIFDRRKKKEESRKKKKVESRKKKKEKVESRKNTVGDIGLTFFDALREVEFLGMWLMEKHIAAQITRMRRNSLELSSDSSKWRV